MNMSPEGRLDRIRPSASVAALNLVDHGGRYVEPGCNRFSRMTGGAEVTNHPHVDRIEFGGGVTHAPNINEAQLPLKASVVRAADPFEIGDEVVLLIAIDVIDGGTFKFSGHKSAGDEPMDEEFRPLAADLLADRKISMVSHPRPDEARLQSLRDQPSLSRSCGDALYGCNTPVRRHQECRRSVFGLRSHFVGDSK